MERLVADAEGIAVSVDLTNGYVIDTVGFEHHAFTPYAAYEAGHGRRFQERTGTGLAADNWSDITRREFEAAAAIPIERFADRFRVLIGCEDASAVTFKRQQQRVALLHVVAAGVEANDGEYHAARMWKHRPNGGNSSQRSFDVFRLATLQWRTASSAEWRDFPQYIQAAYEHLDRYTAWLVAWALVRAAYLDDLKCADELLDAAARPSKKNAHAFDSWLSMTIKRLKAASMT